MKHVSKTEWNEYLAGACGAQRLAWIDEHVKSCTDCQASMRRALAVRDMMGHWQVDASGHDIAQKVAEAVKSNTVDFNKVVGHPVSHRFWVNFLRIAAMVLLGIFLGYVAGRSSARQHIAKQEGIVIERTPSYLAALNFQFSSDLVHSVLEDNHSPAEDKP